MSDWAILKGAEEFSLGDGPVGALLVHGFTGSPQGMRGLGAYLAERGVAVEGIRLPGHGTTWEDLALRRAAEWVEAVEAGYRRLAEGRDAVFAVGLSFGAALAIDLAVRNPEVSGVVSLAGFVATRDPRRFLSPLIRRFVRSLPGVGNDLADPASREIVYDRVPTAAAVEMLRFCRGVRRRLPLLRCPLLIVHSRKDHTALPFNAELIHKRAGSADKRLVWLRDSYHVITLDLERDRVFEETLAFIREHSSRR